MSLNAAAKVENNANPVIDLDDAAPSQPKPASPAPKANATGSFQKGTPSSNLKWLERANHAPQGFQNREVRDQIQAVQDYCGVVRSDNDSNRKHDAMERAGVAMHKLEVLNKDPKLSQHDRAAIAATKKIYDRHHKLNLGQTHDEDVKLIKMSHDRHFMGDRLASTPPANSQMAKLQKPEAPKSPHHGPAHTRKEPTMVAKAKPAPHHAAPKSAHAANHPHHHPHLPQKIGAVQPKHGPKEIHEAPHHHGPQKIGATKPKHGPVRIEDAPHAHGPKKIGSVKPKHGPVKLDAEHAPKTPKRLG